MKRRLVTAIALGSVLALGLSAWRGGGTTDITNHTTPEFNAALGKIFNPSEKTGGTIKFANSGDWDTLDPGETYYGYSWDFLRLYGRALVMFKPGPGDQSNELIPDLAETLGVPSDGGKT